MSQRRPSPGAGAIAEPGTPTRQWAALRETYGVMVPSSDAIAKLVSAQPELRSMTPLALAARLGVPLEMARTGIRTLGRETFGSPPAGTSPDATFDDLTLAAGRFHTPVELVTGADGHTSTAPIAGPINPLAHLLTRRR